MPRLKEVLYAFVVRALHCLETVSKRGFPVINKSSDTPCLDSRRAFAIGVFGARTLAMGGRAFISEVWV